VDISEPDQWKWSSDARSVALGCDNLDEDFLASTQGRSKWTAPSTPEDRDIERIGCAVITSAERTESKLVAINRLRQSASTCGSFDDRRRGAAIS